MGTLLGAGALRSAFAAQGFVFPVRILSAHEAATAERRYREYRQLLDEQKLEWSEYRFKSHLLLPWVWDLVNHPAIVQSVQAVLGTERVSVWSTDWVPKPPKSSSKFSWHQDSTYAGMQPAERVVTVWLALCSVTARAGCVQFIPGSHTAGQLPHQEIPDASNMLAFGQTCPATGDPTSAVLQPGEASIHSFLTVHGSGGNEEDWERLGLAIRYFCSADVQKSDAVEREMVTCVAGEPSPYFDLEPAPIVPFGEAEQALWKEAMRRENSNYFQGSSEKAHKL
mmetsp:Transcript_32687/g.84754  ORF Transcript_32687/g.84754 Transcript_32687/m.84754 type:complete len:282 (+) Transcript_32687:23-868(+)